MPPTGKPCLYYQYSARTVFFNPRPPDFSKKRACIGKKCARSLAIPARTVYGIAPPETSEGNGLMRNGHPIHRDHLRAQSYLAAAAMLLCVLLLDLVLTLFAAGRGAPPSGGFLSDPAPASRSFRTAAERTGNLAAMHDGAGNGVQVQMRGGRTSPTFARRLQTDTAHPGPAYVHESVPMRRERLESTAQTFLFQLFPRCFLPVRAGPRSAC